MRPRLRSLRPTMLTLAFTALLAVPAAAQSGAGATIAMQPASAAPGSAVEVSGVGFPTEMSVNLRLATETGTFDLATAATGRDGTFSHLVVLPALPVAGTWAVEAWAADGTSASHAFDASAPVVAAVEAPVVEERPVPAAAVASSDGNATVDGVVLVIIGLLLGMVSTGALYAWRLLHEERIQPGMGQGDDVIWSDRHEAESAEPTATSEPFWKAAPHEAEVAPHQAEAAAHEAEAAPREVVDSGGEQEAPASA